MKKILLIALALGLSGSVHAEKLAEGVVADLVTAVGFAPPAFRGIYHFQVLDTGVVQTIDNKGKKVRLAKLAPSLMQNLIDKIDEIKGEELTKPTTPPCMDAPTQSLYVQNSEGKEWKPWTRSGCRDFESVDYAGQEVSRAIVALKGALSSFSALGN